MVLRNGRPYDPAWDLWRPVRRWPGVLLAALVTAGLLTAIAYHYEHRVPAAPRPIFTTAPQLGLSGPYYPPVHQDSEPYQKFTGSASASGIAFTSNGELATWEFNCRCDNNFFVLVHDAQNNLVGVPVNSLGRTKSIDEADYPAGEYTMDVGASGKWSVVIVPEGGLPLIKTPFEYVSTGTSVLGPFPPNHRHVIVQYKASLGQLFSVQAVDKYDNQLTTGIVTVKSTYQRLTLPVQPAPYYLVVSGAGLWLIHVT